MIVIVVEKNECLLFSTLDTDTATTLVALISEDPSDWDEAIACWTRYSSPAVCEFASSLVFSKVDFEEAVEAAGQTDEWVAIDFRTKRILTGREFMEVGRDQVFAMVVDDSGDQHCPLGVHLPPWWELREHVEASAINEPRQTPMNRPRVNRDVLFGEPLLRDLASRIASVVVSQAWTSSDACENERSRYRFTLEVHRYWLMTPREDLGGRMPRQLLHGAHAWIDKVVWAQRIRFEDGAPMIAAPDDFADYDTAPMGSEEMVVYFDLCRELIQTGWIWSVNDQMQSASQDAVNMQSELVEFLRDVRDEWLSSPFEGGSTPSFIIECSRRRVPRGAGVPIVGMTTQQSEQHVIDCDCPICNMMEEGMFGIGFAGLDGHHLDLDDEFAFSMYETHEEWMEMRQDYEDFSAEVSSSQSPKETEGETETDEFQSVWSGVSSDEPIPGDPFGHVKLAFLLSEIISILQSSDAPRTLIKQINESFSDYRTSDATQATASAKEFCAVLQGLTDDHPMLISKVCDLQSRIDEQLRN